MNSIEQLINDEKYNLELKKQVNFDEPKNYLKAVSSFANGYDIGYILFGIEDETKKIIGVNNLKKSYEEIANRIKTRIDPSIIPIIDIVKIGEKNIIVVKVLPGQTPPYYYVNKGTRIAYIRKGDQDCETNSLELNELILRGKNMGWDEQITDMLYDNFTFETLKKYFKEIKKYDVDKNTLISFGLIKNNKLTNAALLFSDQNPVTGSFISCTRWQGLDKIIAKDDEEYTGCVLNQIDKAMDFIKKHNCNGWIREQGKVTRTDISEYDLASIREAIINAVAHRNYLRRGTNVEVGFYDDRIEVVSCGKVEVFDRTLDEFFKSPTSERRNQLVCDIFSRLNYMERRGSGIKKIYAAYEKDEKKPTFKVVDGIFTAQFFSRFYNIDFVKLENASYKNEIFKNYRDSLTTKNSGINDKNSGVNGKNSGINDKNSGVNGKNSGINDKNSGVNDKNSGINNKNVVIETIKEKYPKLKQKELDIIELIIKNKSITQKDIAIKLNKTESTIYKNISNLKKQKILKRIGSNKTGYWQINI